MNLFSKYCFNISDLFFLCKNICAYYLSIIFASRILTSTPYVKAIIKIKYNHFQLYCFSLHKFYSFVKDHPFFFSYLLFVPSAIFIILHRPNDLIYLIRKQYFASLFSHSIHICVNFTSLVWLSSDFSVSE